MAVATHSQTAVGEERSYVWFISKTEMRSYQLPSQKTIEDLIKKARSQFTNRVTNRGRFLEETIDLSNLLLKPIRADIGNKRLAVIADGALQNISFAALPDPRIEDNQYQPLLVNNEVVYLPSASTLQALRDAAQNRPTPSKTLAILADPVFSANDPRVSQQPNPTGEAIAPLDGSQQMGGFHSPRGLALDS